MFFVFLIISLFATSPSLAVDNVSDLCSDLWQTPHDYFVDKKTKVTVPPGAFLLRGHLKLRDPKAQTYRPEFVLRDQAVDEGILEAYLGEFELEDGDLVFLLTDSGRVRRALFYERHEFYVPFALAEHLQVKVSDPAFYVSKDSEQRALSVEDSWRLFEKQVPAVVLHHPRAVGDKNYAEYKDAADLFEAVHGVAYPVEYKEPDVTSSKAWKYAVPKLKAHVAGVHASEQKAGKLRVVRSTDGLGFTFDDGVSAFQLSPGDQVQLLSVQGELLDEATITEHRELRSAAGHVHSQEEALRLVLQSPRAKLVRRAVPASL